MEASQAVKPPPTSVRLSATADELIRAEAARSGRSKSAVLRAVAEEGIRERAFPGIGFRDVEPNRRAWVIGTGCDVWTIIEIYKDFDKTYDNPIERMVDDYDQFWEQAIRLALAYYKRFPEEIDRALERNRAAAEEYKDLFPTFYFNG